MPSQKILNQKQQVVNELSEKFKAAASGVVVNYSGITVADDTALRAALRKEGIEYSVIKNTLIGRACDNVGYSDLKKTLEGMTAVAITTGDPVAPAKILKEFADKIPTLELKGGFVDGAVLDKKGVEALAAIPPKPMLIGKMLGSLQKSLYGLCYVLQAKIDKENGGASAEA
jgi:large subunit ribosomal protein L10